MTVKEWLREFSGKLDEAGIGTARLDCEILLADAMEKDRSWLLAHPEQLILKSRLNRLDMQIEDRANHKPLAYIRHKTEFYGREFYIDERVLEPRPETETMIELFLKQILHKDGPCAGTIVDVGTGSGAIAVTVKLELPEFDVIAIDKDKNCLDVAMKNAKQLGADITFHQGDLLTPLSNYKLQTTSYTLLANLPYVPDSYQINQAALHEPKDAIYGGEDGLDLYRRLFDQSLKLSSKPKYILTESLPFQHAEMEVIAKKHGYRQVESEDFIQVFELESH